MNNLIENSKIPLAIIGIICLAIGLIVSRLFFLFKVGFAIIALWAVLTIFTWKKNELSENLIAVVILLVGLGFAGLFYGGRILAAM